MSRVWSSWDRVSFAQAFVIHLSLEASDSKKVFKLILPVSDIKKEHSWALVVQIRMVGAGTVGTAKAMCPKGLLVGVNVLILIVRDMVILNT